MEIRKEDIHYLGLIKNWNKILNDKVCIVLNTKKISYNPHFNLVKVLVEDQVYTIPNNFIKKL